MKKIKGRLIESDENPLKFDIRGDVLKLGSMINLCIDKINELVEKVNELEAKIEKQKRHE